MTIEVTVLQDGTALIELPAGVVPDSATLENVCKTIKEKRLAWWHRQDAARVNPNE